MNAMADLVNAGKIRSVGVSNLTPSRCAGPSPVAEARFATGDKPGPLQPARSTDETNGVLETAKELGVTIIAYTPLGSGMLTGKYHRIPNCLKRNPNSGA